jgi:hypothetical protein
MTTKDHLIFSLLELARAGRVSDDETLTPELMSYWIDNTRAMLIGQWIDKGRSINPDIIQVIPCMEITQVDASECGCESTGCIIYRTVEELPETLESSKGVNLVTRVASVDIRTPAFSFMPYERAIWSGGSKFTRSTPKAFLRNRYIYIMTDKYLGDKISVSLVAAYPEDLESFSTCAGEPCYSKTSRYPIPARMIETMEGMIKENKLKIAIQVPGDDINNANGIVNGQKGQE